MPPEKVNTSDMLEKKSEINRSRPSLHQAQRSSSVSEHAHTPINFTFYQYVWNWEEERK